MSNTRPRVLFFGMDGMFSSTVLTSLLSYEIEICALILPSSPLASRLTPSLQRREPPSRRRTALSLLSVAPSLVQVAWDQQLPVWEVKRLSAPETIAQLASYNADLLCVACFSLRIPRVLLNLPRLGAFNVHPSLLPANRGPVPLFWTFREGHSLTGVTIHALEEKLDSGPIFAQAQVPVPDGISYYELEMQAAKQGGELLAQTILQVYHGNTTHIAQDEHSGSYHSFPEPADLLVPTEQWEARRVYNFIQGVGLWDGPVILQSADYRLPTTRAISYSTKEIFPSRGAVVYQDALAWVRCLDGWVQINVTSAI